MISCKCPKEEVHRKSLALSFSEVRRDIDERPNIYPGWFRMMRHGLWNDIVGSLNGSVIEPQYSECMPPPVQDSDI